MQNVGWRLASNACANALGKAYCKNIGKRLAKHADASELKNIYTVITSGLQIMQMPPP
jgi:hypothetical protein